MENQQNQQLETKPMWMIMAGVLLVVGCAVLPMGRRSNEDRVVRARAKAEVLAYQVAQLYRENSTSEEASKVRGPASVGGQAVVQQAVGVMGQDPWGKAYQYKIDQVGGGKLRIRMVSAGPDGSLDHTKDNIQIQLSL